MRYLFLLLTTLYVMFASTTLTAAEPSPQVAEEGFVSLFDGKTLDGWKVTEKEPKSWTVEDGAIVANGQPKSHLFYVGDDKPFENFELRADVWTEPGSNGGIYFHTQYQPEGWPKYGFEAQVNNAPDKDPRKTGSLYAVKDVLTVPAEDRKWFTETIIVNGKNVTIKINDKVVTEYTEPADQQAGKDFTRKLDKGTFALQGHDPKSIVKFKNLRVKRLP